MVGGQLQVDSTHTRKQFWKYERSSDAFVHFVCVENRKLAESVRALL